MNIAKLKQIKPLARVLFLAFLVVGCDNPKSRIGSYLEKELAPKANTLGMAIHGRQNSLKVDVLSATEGWYEASVTIKYSTTEDFVTEGSVRDCDVGSTEGKLKKLKSDLESAHKCNLTDPRDCHLIPYTVPKPGVILALSKNSDLTVGFKVKGSYGKESCSITDLDEARFTPELQKNWEPASKFPNQKVFQTEDEYAKAFNAECEKKLAEFYREEESALRGEAEKIIMARSPFKPGTKYACPYSLQDRQMTVVLEILDYDTGRESFSAVMYDREDPSFRKSYEGELAKNPSTKKLSNEPTVLVGDRSGPLKAGLHTPDLFEAVRNRIHLTSSGSGNLHGRSRNLMKGDRDYEFKKLDAAADTQ